MMVWFCEHDMDHGRVWTTVEYDPFPLILLQGFQDVVWKKIPDKYVENFVWAVECVHVRQDLIDVIFEYDFGFNGTEYMLELNKITENQFSQLFGNNMNLDSVWNNTFYGYMIKTLHKICTEAY